MFSNDRLSNNGNIKSITLGLQTSYSGFTFTKKVYAFNFSPETFSSSIFTMVTNPSFWAYTSSPYKGYTFAGTNVDGNTTNPPKIGAYTFQNDVLLVLASTLVNNDIAFVASSGASSATAGYTFTGSGSLSQGTNVDHSNKFTFSSETCTSSSANVQSQLSFFQVVGCEYALYILGGETRNVSTGLYSYLKPVNKVVYANDTILSFVLNMSTGAGCLNGGSNSTYVYNFNRDEGDGGNFNILNIVDKMSQASESSFTSLPALASRQSTTAGDICQTPYNYYLQGGANDAIGTVWVSTSERYNYPTETSHAAIATLPESAIVTITNLLY